MFSRIKIVYYIIILMVIQIEAKILTLNEAEHTAITTGYETRAEYFQEQAKEWEKRNVIAQYLPSVNYSLNYLRMDSKTVDEANKMMEGLEDFFSSMGQAIDLKNNPSLLHENTLSHEISLNQPITNGGVEILAIKIANHTKRAIELQQEQKQQDVIFATRSAYLNAISAIERTKVARQDCAWTKQNLANARSKFESGGLPITDVLQWEAEVLKKESDILEAEAVESYSKQSLCQVIGMSIDSVSQITLQPFEVFERRYNNGKIQTTDSISGNLQLQAIQEYTMVAAYSKKIAASSYLPKLNAFCRYTKDQGWNEMDDLYNKPRSWTAGAVLTVPLFTGLKNSTNYKKSSYEYMKTVVDEQRTSAQLAVNLERIKLFYKASYEGVKAAKKQLELMERQLTIMQQRYDGGLANQSQLLEVSLGTSRTKIGYIQKLFECLLYEAEYHNNIGTLEVTQ